MSRGLARALFVIAGIVVVVGADVLFFQHHTTYRLIANVGIVLVFGVFYVRYFRRS